MAVNPIIFDLKYTPYSLKRGASVDEKRVHREERAFYDMTGGKNILGYMMTEDKQRGTFTNALYKDEDDGVCHTFCRSVPLNGACRKAFKQIYGARQRAGEGRFEITGKRSEKLREPIAIPAKKV